MKKLLIYTKHGCPFCAAVKNLFDSKGFEYEEINFFGLSEAELDELMKKTNEWKTASMIFIDGKFYGGYEDIKKLNESGELDSLVRE